MYRRQRRHLHILWWSNLETLFAPLHRSSPCIGELGCQAIQTEDGPYIAERTKKDVYGPLQLYCTYMAVEWGVAFYNLLAKLKT
jgi:hypothetical protein